MRKLLVIIVVVLLAVGLFAGCTSPATSSTTTGSGTQATTAASSGATTGATTTEPMKEKDLYIVATVLAGLDYFQDYKIALKAAENDFGVVTEFVGPTDYNLDTLIATIDQSIAKKPTGIILLGWEDALTPVIDKARDAGIYVFTTAVDLPNSKRNGFIGQSNYEAGKLAAEYLATQCNFKGEVAVLRGITLANVTDRFRGFKEVIDSYPDMKLVADVDNKNDEVIAAQQASSIMQKYPNLVGFLAADGISGPAVSTAVREAGKKGVTKIIAFDRDPTVLAGIEDGLITATLVAGTPFEVYLSIQMSQMMKYGSVQLSYDDEAAGITFCPTYINPGCYVVDINNVMYFKRDYKK